MVDAIQQVTGEILDGDKPVVGAINGWAVGGGFEWAINCDFPIWGCSAQEFFPEVSLNLFVTGAVTTLLPAMVGLNKAREMLMLGDRYNADTLLELGVAWKVALTAELFGGDKGMGYLLNLARQDFDMPLVLAVILVIVAFVYLTERLIFQPLQARTSRRHDLA